MAPGRKTGGRQPGTPNKATRDVRAAIAEFASANVGRMGEWLTEIDDPAKRFDLYLRAIEYHIPKLQRTELNLTGMGTADLVTELERRAKATLAADPGSAAE
jgi:hypothetical protein